MELKKKRYVLFAVLVVVMLIQLDIKQAVDHPAMSNLGPDGLEDPLQVLRQVVADTPPPRTPTDIKELVLDLLEATPLVNRTDYDGDGLYDPVEAVIGTDPESNDTDHDSLTDCFEVFAGLDPLELDTNFDGLPDNQELSVSMSDIDGDGTPNVWDSDNDGDGIADCLDADPFRRTDTRWRFNMSLKLSGVPTYITLQLIPAKSDHLQLIDQYWDWPYDASGAMQDLDNSKEDVTVVPMLNVTLNILPDQSDVEDYGIEVLSHGIHVPISPLQDNERVVAFSSKMFFPATEPITLVMNVELVWAVIGFTDINAIALNSTSNGYVIIDPTGNAMTRESFVGDPALQRIICGENQIALKEVGGSYLSVTEDSLVIANASDIGPHETFNVHHIDNTTVTLESATGGYIAVGTGGVLIANASSSASEHFNMTDLGCRPDSSLLVTYKEGFMLTGMAVEEMYGSTVGLLYSSSRNMTMAADMILPYIFQHNSTNHLADIPALLPDYGISLQSVIESFSHRDEALISASNDLIPSALEYLPENENHPVILTSEDIMKTADLSSITPESYVITGPIDLDVEVTEFATLKSSRTFFYNTSSKIALSLMEVFEEIDCWGLGENASFNIRSMMLRCCAGEYKFSQASALTVSFSPESDLIDRISLIVEIGLEEIGLSTLAVTGWVAYEWLESMQAKGWNAASVSKCLKTKSTGSFFQWAKACRGLDKVGDTAAAAKSIARAEKAILIIGIIVGVGISIWEAVQLSDTIGGSLGRAVGATYGTVAAIVGLVFIGIIYALAQIPYVGWLLAIILVAADMIGGFSDKLVEWLTGVIVGDSETRAEVTPSFDQREACNITITDKDNNGLDAGDRISVAARIVAILSASGPAREAGLEGSWNVPSLSVACPWGSVTWSGEPIPEATNKTYDGDHVIKETTYRCETWIESGIGMPNFPVTLILHSDYRLYNMYKYKWFGLFNVYENVPVEDSMSMRLYTVSYYDMMPGSIDDFIRWRYISPLDHDHDGLNDEDEDADMVWKWDFDQDGLSDKYETIIGTDPRSADTDSDWLSDGWEALYGTNATDPDSDQDGVRDYRENTGWQVNFEFYSTPFKIHVSSDPKMPDSDNDGVEDEGEYRSNTNPRSCDTNGDGVWDEEKTMRRISVEFEDSWGTSQPANTTFNEIDCDGNGSVYILMSDGSYYWDEEVILHYNGTWWITKLDSNLSVVPTGPYFSEFFGDPESPPSLTIDEINETFYYLVHMESGRDHVASLDLNGSVLDGTAELDVQDGWGRMFDINFASPDRLYGITDYDWYRGDIDAWEIESPTSLSYIGTWRPAYMSGMWYLEYFQASAYCEQNHYVYVACGEKVFGFGPTETVSPFLFDAVFTDACGITVSDDGIVYVVDRGAHNVRAFDLNGEVFTYWGDAGIWGSQGYEDGNFTNPEDIAVSKDGTIYVIENWDEGGRVQRLRQDSSYQSDFLNATEDSDSDGLTNEAEVIGWQISITDSTGIHLVNVSSNPLLNDSDYDGLDDCTEWQLSTNPQSADSDGDGLEDFSEIEIGSNPRSWDSDGDLLGDGTEMTFGSDVMNPDSDADGLTDLAEFLLGSDANSTDTDNDGLNDKTEFDFNSSPVSADTDGDLMFDALEYEEGTNPNSLDSDGDDVVDGIESIFGTDPSLRDTDGDGAADGLELALWLNPLCNDTDGDGLRDMEELELGTSPWTNDTDCDGIPDLYDSDSYETSSLDVLLVSDSGILLSSQSFCESLSSLSQLSLLTYDDFSPSYRDSPYIVMIGRPEEGASGIRGLLYEVLEDTGSVLEGMMELGSHQVATRYGVWTETQTVVMLTDATVYDVYSVLAALRGKEVTVLPNTIRIEYSSCAVSASNYTARYKMDSIDAVKQTDCVLAFMIDTASSVVLNVTRYDEETTPHPLTSETGLINGDVSLGKYVSIQLTVGGTGVADVEAAIIRIYYRYSDLDVNGNGLLNDTMDIDETTLAMYHFDESDGYWTRLSLDLEWVYALGVNTTDVELYGEIYAGYVWVQVTRLSLFALAGGPISVEVPWAYYAVVIIAASAASVGVFFVIRRKMRYPKRSGTEAQLDSPPGG